MRPSAAEGIVFGNPGSIANGAPIGNGPLFSVQYFTLVYIAIHPGVDF
jgi:hypothetical protein